VRQLGAQEQAMTSLLHAVETYTNNEYKTTDFNSVELMQELLQVCTNVEYLLCDVTSWLVGLFNSAERTLRS
jgi:hypothetical protein